jgi:GH15 family glucan-1,4-alpha-glucosidase
MYGLGGERRLHEMELPWLPGYEHSRPVRIGNAASTQFQLDVWGEVMDALHAARRVGDDVPPEGWAMQRAMMHSLETLWQQPDEGIWEVRGPRRHFTHSKVMAWVAVDRAVKAVERFGLDGPADRWRALRAQIHEEVCRRGWNPERGAFVQYYDGTELDASLLMIPCVGFLPPTDPRVVSTIDAIQRELCTRGFVRRYLPAGHVDGLPGAEGEFLPCSFWLVDALLMLGRRREARALFERLLAVCNDVGLLSEEYEPGAKRLLGNFPQAFSHVSLVNTARNFADHAGPAEQRRS